MENYVGSYNVFQNKLIRNFCFPGNERGIGVPNLITCYSILGSVFIAGILNCFIPRHVLLWPPVTGCVLRTLLALCPVKITTLHFWILMMVIHSLHAFREGHK